jgi:glycosyltransferase involved in cell wall biosynthesis
MRIWIFFHYAETPNEMLSAPFDVAKLLVEKGHEVTFFASSYSHYKSKDLRLQAGETWRAERFSGVRFVWIKTFPYQKSDWRRILNMITFGWRGFWVAQRLPERPDIVIGSNPHPFAVLAGYCTSVFKKARFVYEVRDLWPLTLTVVGELRKKSPAARIMSMLEQFFFNRAERIIMVWPKMDEYGAKRGVPRDKFAWIPQCVDLNRYSALRPYDGIASTPFTIMFLGSHVRMNAIDVVLRAAYILQEEKSDGIRFVFVGDGQQKLNLIELAKDLHLRNVEFRDMVPRAKLPNTMNEADAFVLSMRNLPELYQYGISWNKLADYLVAGRPILLAGNPAYNAVSLAGAGLTVPPEDPAALAQAAKQLFAMSAEERTRMGANGNHYARQMHDARILADRLEQTLQSASPHTSAGRAAAIVSEPKSTVVP